MNDEPVAPSALREDAELVRRAAAGERAAQEQIVNQHYPRILRYLTGRAGNRHDAEDLAQETFVVALQELGRVQLRVPLIAYLTSIAYRPCARLHRDNARYRTAPLPERLAPEFSPAEAVEENDALERLDAAARAHLNDQQYA